MMEVLTFDRSLTQLKGFFVYILLLHVEILKGLFKLNAEIPLTKKLKSFLCTIVLNCFITLVSKQFVHNLKMCQYVNLSSLNKYCVQTSVNRFAKLSKKTNLLISKTND